MTKKKVYLLADGHNGEAVEIDTDLSASSSNDLLCVFDNFFKIYNVTEKDKQELISRLHKCVGSYPERIEQNFYNVSKKFGW